MTFSNKLERFAMAVLLAALICAAIGCREEPIEKYRVARLNAPAGGSPAGDASAGGNSATDGAGVATRMVAGIVEKPDGMWVFKIVGPPGQIAAAESAWRPFLEQLTFGEDGAPRWTLPEGWKELPGNQFRHKTLTIPGSELPLELAVSRLPPGQDLLLNVNRWRGQLALPPAQAVDLETGLKKIAIGGDSLLLFDETGTGSGGMAPAASNARPQPPADAPIKEPAPPAELAELPFEFTPPENWVAGATTSFTLRRFVKTEGDQSVQLAITRLQTSGQSWVDNVSVWCGELGIPALTAAEADQQTKEVTIDGRPAKSIGLQSDEATGKASRIVCWVGETESWFFKLTGDASLVASSEAAFDQLLQSIRFKPPQ